VIYLPHQGLLNMKESTKFTETVKRLIEQHGQVFLYNYNHCEAYLSDYANCVEWDLWKGEGQRIYDNQ